MQIGNYASGPLQVALLANNTPPPGHRALIMAVNSMGNLVGVIAAVGIHWLRRRLSVLTFNVGNISSPIRSHLQDTILHQSQFVDLFLCRIHRFPLLPHVRQPLEGQEGGVHDTRGDRRGKQWYYEVG